MSEIAVDGIANFDGIKFKFISPLNLNPNDPFPDDILTANGELPLASVDISSVGKEFSIKNPGEIKFSVGAEFNAALGVYRKTKNLLEALEKDGLNQQLANLLNLNIGGGENLYAMRWGYKLSGGVDGKVPLFSMGAPVNLTFGVSGKTGGLSVLLHSRDKNEPAVKALKETLESWKLPHHVESFENLNPKTTVIFETLSDLKVALGVEYGYEFNWVRDSIKIGNLSGELGAKFEMGFGAKFGFSAVGDYALALTRESNEEKIRVQVFRLKQKGWSFAFDGGISAQATKLPVPPSLDEFIKGVFNLNSSQVLKDFEKIFDPNTTLADLLGTTSVNEINEFLRRITGFDLETGMEKLKSFIEKWHELPQEVTSYLYKFIGKATGDELNQIKGFLTRIIGFAEAPDSIVDEIKEHIKAPDFYTSPIGKWLTASAKEGIVSLLAKMEIDDERDKFVGFAEQTIGFLDGSELTNILKKFQEEIDSKLGLDKIKDLNPNEWLLKRLTDLFGNSVVDELDKVRNIIIELQKKGQEFYDIGYKALLKKYSFDVHYAFQKTTANTSLIDLTLDFTHEPEEAKKYLEQAKDGNFTNLLLGKDENDKPITCATINQAVLTHEIKRSTHLGVNLPNFSATVDHITNSIAEGKLVEAEDGKLWVFTLKAEDIVKKRKSLSKLAIAAELLQGTKTDIRTYDDKTSSLEYSFLYGGGEVGKKFVEKRFEAGSDKYLSSGFPENTGTFSIYLDQLLDSLKKKELADDEFKKVLASLKITMPGNIMSFWEKVPENLDNPFYKEMSSTVQRALREWIMPNFIQSKKHYEDAIAIFPLLAYSSLPNNLTDVERDDGVFYWKFDSDSGMNEVLHRAEFEDKFSDVLADAFERSSDDRYKPSNMENIRNRVLNNPSNLSNQTSKKLFKDLCDLELDMIKGIVDTAKAFHEFKKAAIDKKAKPLADFGEKFTRTFNDEIGDLEAFIPKGSLRPFGLLLFLRITQLLGNDFNEKQFAAMFEVLVLDPATKEADFKAIRKRFLDGDFPDLENEKDMKSIAFQQRIVNVDALPQ